jgi:SSS family transporter
VGLIVDAAIIVLYFVVVATIGLIKGRHEKNLSDFALGGRKIPWWAVMASIIAAETSAATFLGAPTEGFRRQSLAYALLTFGVIIGRWIVGNWFLKPYYEYRVYTVYDYLGIRFGPRTKSAASGLFLVMRTLASGTRLFIPSIVVVLAWQLIVNGGEATAVPQQPSLSVWPYFIAILVITVFTGIYTAKGGIKAVIWTDVLQAGVMFGSALLAAFYLFGQVGGFHRLAELVPNMGSIGGYFSSGFDADSIRDWQVAQHLISNGAPSVPMTAGLWIREMLTNDYTLVSALVAATALNVAAFGADQDMVQRLLTAETSRKARRSLLTAAFMDIPIACVFTFIGILLYAYYRTDVTYLPKSQADVFASYILNVMPVGLRGIVLAGVMATAMGSLSAAMNSLATSATNDFYLPAKSKRATVSDAETLRAARFFTYVFAALMIVVAVAFAYLKVNNPDLGIIPVVLGVAGYILGPMLGVFLLGIFTKGRGSDRGNLIALVLGLLATTIVGDLPGKMNPAWKIPWPWEVSFTWFALIGAVVVFLVGVLFATPPKVLEEAQALRARLAESS